jgi:hypothetical protein
MILLRLWTVINGISSLSIAEKMLFKVPELIPPFPRMMEIELVI